MFRTEASVNNASAKHSSGKNNNTATQTNSDVWVFWRVPNLLLIRRQDGIVRKQRALWELWLAACLAVVDVLCQPGRAQWKMSAKGNPLMCYSRDHRVNMWHVGLFQRPVVLFFYLIFVRLFLYLSLAFSLYLKVTKTRKSVGINAVAPNFWCIKVTF